MLSVLLLLLLLITITYYYYYYYYYYLLLLVTITIAMVITILFTQGIAQSHPTTIPAPVIIQLAQSPVHTQTVVAVPTPVLTQTVPSTQTFPAPVHVPPPFPTPSTQTVPAVQPPIITQTVPSTQTVPAPVHVPPPVPTPSTQTVPAVQPPIITQTVPSTQTVPAPVHVPPTQTPGVGCNVHQFTECVGPVQSLPSSATSMDYFNLLFTDNMFDHIVEQTNLYATQNPPSVHYKWEDITSNELKAFFGLIILMGIKRLPAYEDYFSQCPILSCPELVRGFSRNRFKAILCCLHLNDNTTAQPRGNPGYDKLHKVRPLLKSINETIQQEYVPHKENSIDEAMIGFKGRSTLLQYMPLKPTKRGYKVWCRCDAKTGYMCEFDIYTGASLDRGDSSLSSYVVKKLTESIYNKGYIIYCDNYFSSVELLKDLLSKKTYCIATTRSNRRHFPNSLKGLKLQRGESKSEIVQGTVEALHWTDKKGVLFLNTFSSPTSMTSVARKQSDGTRIMVDCPIAVKLYNENMGGVDLHDQKRKLYSCSRRSKKWWHRIFYFVLDLAIVNAYILECESRPSKRPQKHFRVELLSIKFVSRKRKGRPSLAVPVVRLCERHFPEKCDKRRECIVCKKKGRRVQTYFTCDTCKDRNGRSIALCPSPCMRIYHTKYNI